MLQEKEARILTRDEANFRVDQGEDGEYYLKGTAIVFNKLSVDFGGWKEKISRSAVEGANMDEIICKFNHDINEVLGTTWGGTLTYSIDDIGVHYSCKLPREGAGKKVRELAERGDLRGNSFEFILNANGAVWDEVMEDGKPIYIRNITSIEGVYDFAPVMRPAYPDTNNTISIAKRSLEDYIASKPKPEPEIDKELEYLKLHI